MLNLITLIRFSLYFVFADALIQSGIQKCVTEVQALYTLPQIPAPPKGLSQSCEIKSFQQILDLSWVSVQWDIPETPLTGPKLKTLEDYPNHLRSLLSISTLKALLDCQSFLQFYEETSFPLPAFVILLI